MSNDPRGRASLVRPRPVSYPVSSYKMFEYKGIEISASLCVYFLSGNDYVTIEIIQL